MPKLLRISVFTTILLAICHLTSSQIPFPRSCPEVKVPKEFNTEAYLGTWYEYAKYPYIFELAKRCMFAHYTNKGNNTMGVVNTSVNTISGLTTNTTGVARILAPSQLNVLFNKYPNPVDIPNYIVLGTDYRSYSVVYSCNNLTTLAHTKLLWILTRERKPTAEVVTAAKKVMDESNLPQSFLLVTDQDNCPEVVSGYGTNIYLGDHNNGIDNNNKNNIVHNNNNNNNNNNSSKNNDNAHGINNNKVNKTLIKDGFNDHEGNAVGDVIFVVPPKTTVNPTDSGDALAVTAETATNVIEVA